TPATVTTIAASTAVVTAPAVTTATVASTATIAVATTTTGWGRLGIGQSGTLKGLNQFKTDLPPVDLTDPHLEHVTIVEVVLDPFDPLGAVEPRNVEQTIT